MFAESNKVVQSELLQCWIYFTMEERAGALYVPRTFS